MMVNFYSGHVQCNKSRNATIDDVVGEYQPTVSLLQDSTLAGYCNFKQLRFTFFYGKEKLHWSGF